MTPAHHALAALATTSPEYGPALWCRIQTQERLAKGILTAGKAMEIKLVKRTPQGLETITLWVAGNAVQSVRVRTWEGGAKSEKKSHAKPEKAQAALDAQVAALLGDGYAYRDGPPKSAAAKTTKSPAASRARPVERPAWAEHPAIARPRAKLLSLVEKAGLSHRGLEIEALAKPTIAFAVKKVAKAPPGVSRLGGPAEVATPGKLHFVAQIALADIHPLDLEGALPARGLLSFFAQLDESRDDYGSVGKVVHSEGPDAMVRGAASRAQAMALLTPALVLTLPYYEDPAVEALRLTDEERERYHDVVYLGLMPEEPAHLLLGYGSTGTEHSLEGRPFLAQFASDDRIGFHEGDEQTLRFHHKTKKRDLGAVVCTLEDA